MSVVFLCYSLFLIFEIGTSLGTEVTSLTRLVGQRALGSLPLLPLYGDYRCALLHWLLVWVLKDLNPGLHACMANSFLSEPSLQVKD